MAKKEYKKLAGRGRRQGETYNWCTLHLGADHLLQIEHSGYSEDYRRFYFGDIQAFIVRQTNRARNYTIFFSIMIAFGAAWELFVTSIEARIAWGCWIALFLLLESINLIKGTACVCHVKTAVQVDQLPSLKRVKKCDKVLRTVRTLIAAQQGLLSATEAQSRFAAGEHLATGTQGNSPSSTASSSSSGTESSPSFSP